MHIVTIKMKGKLPERFFSEGTAIVGDNKTMEVTLTEVRDGEKKGAKFYLGSGDSIKIRQCGDNPKGKVHV